MAIFCVRWKTKYYVFVRLVFGCRSSPRIFETLSQAVCWIALNNYGIQKIFHLLDDFLTVDKPDSCTGERTMAVLSLLFNRLCIPLAKHKCVGPTHCLEYLVLILSCTLMLLWLVLVLYLAVNGFVQNGPNNFFCRRRWSLYGLSWALSHSCCSRGVGQVLDCKTNNVSVWQPVNSEDYTERTI